MANNKLAIIGGSGLYDVEEFKDREFIKIDTPWGKPSLRDPTAETEIISVTPSCLSASIFALKLIFEGETKWPLPCLGRKKTSLLL